MACKYYITIFLKPLKSANGCYMRDAMLSSDSSHPSLTLIIDKRKYKLRIVFCHLSSVLKPQCIKTISWSRASDRTNQMGSSTHTEGRIGFLFSILSDFGFFSRHVPSSLVIGKLYQLTYNVA
jgi:hypothetical protein